MKLTADFNKQIEYLEEAIEVMNSEYQTNAKSMINVINLVEQHLMNLELNIDGIEVVISDIKKTTGGVNGDGLSFLIEATVEGQSDYERLIICKLSDHSKYNHEIMIYDWCDAEDIEERLTAEAIMEVIEEEIDLEELK